MKLKAKHGTSYFFESAYVFIKSSIALQISTRKQNCKYQQGKSNSTNSMMTEIINSDYSQTTTHKKNQMAPVHCMKANISSFIRKKPIGK